MNLSLGGKVGLGYLLGLKPCANLWQRLRDRLVDSLWVSLEADLIYSLCHSLEDSLWRRVGRLVWRGG